MSNTKKKPYGFISNEYRALNMKHHIAKKEAGKPWGNDGQRHVDTIDMFAERLGAKTVLDYGCGNGSFKRETERRWPGKYAISEYDPCVMGKCEKRPEKADLVVCTDVIEHVEHAYLDGMIYELYNRALKGVYMTISTREANETLPDGSNAHRVVRSAEWWLNKLTDMKLPIDNAFIGGKAVAVWLVRPQAKEYDGYQPETKRRSWYY